MLTNLKLLKQISAVREGQSPAASLRCKTSAGNSNTIITHLSGNDPKITAGGKHRYYMMEGWMDGWVDGWMGGWMMDGWMDRWVDNGWMGG